MNSRPSLELELGKSHLSHKVRVILLKEEYYIFNDSLLVNGGISA